MRLFRLAAGLPDLLGLLPFVLAYAAGTCYQQVLCGWAKSRADVRRTHEDA